MSNLFDYLNWRGDLTLEQSAFNEVDSLILSELSYINFTDIVPAPGDAQGVSICNVCDKIVKKRTSDTTLISNADEQIIELLLKLQETPRFANLVLNCYVEHTDLDTIEQFCAVTFEIDHRHIYCSFRGTDDSLTGWREDLELSCTDEVPAQKRAVRYVQAIAKQYPRRKILLGGHSKGGNLAVYAGLFVPIKLQKRILDIWSNDGPGFHEYILNSPNYKRLESRIHTILPKSSIVGMLLEHGESYTVVDSDELGLLQHNPFSWQVLGNHFVTLPSINIAAQNSSLAIRNWLQSVSMEQRKSFIDALFGILNSSGANSISSLKNEHIRAVIPMIKAMMNIDKEVRNGLLDFIQLLLTHNTKIMIEDFQQEARKKIKK